MQRIIINRDIYKCMCATKCNYAKEPQSNGQSGINLLFTKLGHLNVTECQECTIPVKPQQTRFGILIKHIK